MEMLIITGVWGVILVGIFLIGVVVDKLITKIFDKEQDNETGNRDK